MVYKKYGGSGKFDNQQLAIMAAKEREEKERQKQSLWRQKEEENKQAEIENLKKYINDEWKVQPIIEHGGNLEIEFRKNGTDEKVHIVIKYRENFETARELLGFKNNS